jgi:hypothetical protein
MNPRSRKLRSVQSVAISCFLFVASAFANNPIPTVVGPPVPQAVVPGSGEFTLTVYGANFVSGAVVNWNRSPRSTTFISARELKAQILASDMATATAGYVTVTNPPPGGGVSSSSYGLVEVHTPTATIVPNRPREYVKGDVPFFLVPADFNNDGILDFAVSDGKEDIEVRLGNGDGTFRFGSFATHNYNSGDAIAYGDFNNDGNEDLVFGADPFGPPTQLQVSLGNGDGTFRKGARFGHFNVFPFQIVAGDFNGDGKLDTVVLEDGFYVFLGNGDGTFKPPMHYGDAGGYTAVAADFNGDGKLDLAFQGPNYVQILLGNGDGTFQKPRNIRVSDGGCASLQESLQVGDFNGDGKADLAYCQEYNRPGIGVLLGNGDGTFTKSAFIPLPTSGFSYTAGDFNSDGKTDLVANYLMSDTQSEFDLFLGNGDGTFQKKKIVRLGGLHEGGGIVADDFNSDGLLDFIIQDPFQVVVVDQK